LSHLAPEEEIASIEEKIAPLEEKIVQVLGTCGRQGPELHEFPEVALMYEP
jgi:hypothetical protein